MKVKRVLAAVLFVLLTLSAAGVYADADTHNHCVCGKADCTESHESVGATNWQAWNGEAVTSSSETAVYLYLEKDVKITDTLVISDGTVYLCLNGKTLTIDKAGYPAVCVGANQKFVLCDCIGTGKITGAKGSAEKDPARFGAVNCKSGSNFVMYGGSIADNEVKGANGGGIFVNGGTFTMHGGSVNNNKAPNGSGGAVSVENGKIYTYGGEMNGNSAANGGAMHIKGSTAGKIRNIKAAGNTSSDMGGAIFTETKGLIEIHDIELSGNKATRGGGIYLKGAADNIYTNIYNVNIHDNSATTKGNNNGNGGGVFLDGYGTSNQAFSIYDSQIYNNYADVNGGGIFATESAMLNLYGGTISGNTCLGSGGGIRVAGSTYFAIVDYKNPVYINGNTASDGGGISTGANSFNLNGKCEIENNTAKNRGGGVYINNSSMWLVFNKTTVTKNTAPQGGGIYLDKGDTGRDLEIVGGTTVIGNTSSVNGPANNLYLNNGRMFQFRKGLTGTEKVGVSVPGTPTLAEPINIEWVFGYNDEWHDTEGDRSNLIIPDNDSYTAIYDSKLKMHRLIPKPSLTLTADKISVSNLNKPAVLFVASYDGNGLLDIKKIEIGADIEKTIAETALNTVNAVKISAFLWDNSDGKWDVNMYPLCNGAQTNLKDL